jgi:hypothetical protein
VRGVRTLRAEDRAQLAKRALGARERARLLELRAAQHGRGPSVRSGEEGREASLELRDEGLGVARGREPVELVERPAVALPALARLGSRVHAGAPHLRLEAVGEAGHAEEPRRAQVRKQVVGRAARAGRADQCQEAAAEAGVAEAQPAVDRIGDAVRAEDLLEQRRIAPRVAEDDRHVARCDAVAEQVEHPRSGKLHLGAFAAGGVEGDGRARADPPRRLDLEQVPLQVVKRGPRLVRVVVVERRQLELLGAEGQQLLMQAGDRLECEPAALVWKRDRHNGAAPVGENSQRVELEPVEIVEAVGEHRRPAPRRLRSAALRGDAVERRERAAGEQLLVEQARALEAVAITAIKRRDLLRVPTPRSVAGPVPHRAGEPCGAHRAPHAPQFSEKVRAGAHEAWLGRRLGEHVEPCPLDRLLDEQLALEVGRDPRVEAGALGDLLEQPLEAHHSRAEDRPSLGQLPLGVLDVGERGHHQDRILVQAVPEPAQHLARLGGVGRAGYEVERHTEIVATPPDRLTRGHHARPRTPRLEGSGPPAGARAPPAAPSPGSGA